MQVRRATTQDVALVAPLFAAYRQFYDQPYDVTLASRYLSDRLERGESVVLLAEDASAAVVGFTQLYPTFDSVAARASWVLYDLFVAEDCRGRGVASVLLSEAEVVAGGAGAGSLTLSTARTNTVAQRLYERLGWVRDEVFLTYEKLLH